MAIVNSRERGAIVKLTDAVELLLARMLVSIGTRSRIDMRHAIASLCLCTAFTAARAIAAPLDVDAAYGSQGVATSTVAVQPAQVGVSFLQPDGKVIVTVTQGPLFGIHRLSVRRFNADGSVDTGFGESGEVGFSIGGEDTMRKIALQADGKILLAVDVIALQPPFLNSSAIVRLTRNGALDSSFNGTGIVQVADFMGAYDLAVQQDGKILLTGSAIRLPAIISVSTIPLPWYVTRLNADGSRDATFNQGRSVTSRCIAFAGTRLVLLVQGDGQIVVAGDKVYVSGVANSAFCIERLLPNGNPDPVGFTSAAFGVNFNLQRLLEQPDGKLLAAGGAQAAFGSNGIAVARLLPDLSLDATYGTDGKAFIPVGVPIGTVFQSLDFALARDGGLLGMGTQKTSGSQSQEQAQTPVWIRLSPAGEVDATFGALGIARGAEKQRLVGFLRDLEERWLMVSEAALPFGIVNAEITRFQGDRTDRLNVVEFYHARLDHYFITADPGEAAAIDAGSAGPGWVRTGESFKGGGTNFVCRFYGSTSPGPNSHFYTVTPSECGGLKSLQKTTPASERRWNFEDLDFATTPTSGGNCPVATVPVYRVYNNGFARGIDSNHRFSTNRAIIDQMVARGWLYEGPQMCAPQ
jgi:uncharacterized delta-60 repeat protein